MPGDPLRVAVPKGRLSRGIAARLCAAGLDPAVLADGDRRLIRDGEVGGLSLRFVMLKPDDVPTYVEHGACDAGVVGRDVVRERDSDVYLPYDTGLGRCRMVVAAPEGYRAPPRWERLRVATKYPRTAAEHFAARGQDVDVIFVQGSVETAPLAGLSDVIVDLVETGETLRSNGLAEVETVAEVSAVVAVNRVGMKLRREEVARLAALLGATGSRS
ncbi:MAG: ATP phosphoribosyltransferase [Polyangiales bacterium]